MEDDFFCNFDDENGASSEEPRTDSAVKGKEPDGAAPAAFRPAAKTRYPMSRNVFVTILTLSFSALAALVVGVLVGTTDLEWKIWQFLIGIVGGAVATMLLGTAIYWLDERDKVEYHVPVVLLLIGLSILNFVLRCRLADAEYKIIFICLGILISALSFFFVFHMIDAPWITALAIGTVFSIAFLVSGWIMPSWTVWQWIIGVLASILFLAPFFVLEHKGGLMPYSIGLLLSAVFMAVNFLLQRRFGDGYKIIFVWVSASSILSSLISVAFRHSKGEPAWGKVSIFPFLAGVTLLLLGLFLK